MEDKKLTHWKTLVNPKYLGVYSLEPGKDLILTIKEIKNETIMGEGGLSSVCQVLYFEEDCKPMILNKTNLKTIQSIYETPYIDNWVGKQIQLYAKTDIKYAGKKTEGLRIREYIPVKPDEKVIKAIKAITSIEGLTDYYKALSDKDKQVYESYLKDKKIELTKNNKG